MRRVLAALAGLALLWALFLPAAGADDHRLHLDWRPTVVLAVLFIGFAAAALARRRVPRWALATVAALVFAAALLQLVAALVLSFLDRPLDLYFDPPQLPSLFGLFTQSMGSLRATLLFAAALLGAGVLLAAIYASLLALTRACASRRAARGGIVLGLIALALACVPDSFVSPTAAQTAGDEIERLYRATVVLHGWDQRYAATLAAPQPALRALPGLAGHDVFLIFFESYGTIVLDRPEDRAVIAPALADFAATVQHAGYDLVSGRMVSPTFGGGSWLAHGTMASGIKLDPFLDRLVMASSRKSLPRYLSAAGYRTVEVMPGIKKPWPEGSFWGFDKSYYARDLDYAGPPFGWFDIPDQYTLRRFAERELAPGHKPVFAQIVLVSSHTPFAPVPPSVAWSDSGDFKSVSQADWKAIYRQPDWSDLEKPYLQSVVYDLRTLSDWLARLDGEALVIILGDHQPPGFVSGAQAPWTVPVHVLSRDKDLVAPFARAGYVAGALPPAERAPKGMESFLGDFLTDYGQAPMRRADR